MKSDSISKALRDAEKCVELAPEWSKGYSRLGAAQQALKRFQPAMDTFRKGSSSRTFLAILNSPVYRN
jgi:DnaJ homolog subfamily C member 8